MKKSRVGDKRWGGPEELLRRPLSSTTHHHLLQAMADQLPLALSITFEPTSSVICLTLFDLPDHTQAAIPLELKFTYDPSTPYAPIQEVVHDRNNRIKQVRPAPRAASLSAPLTRFVG